jgi:hypothetical protein
LRKLVGERYHDLIDATDGIMRMKELCNSCSSQLSCISQEIRDIDRMVDEKYRNMQKLQQFNTMKHVKKIIDLCDLVCVTLV